MDMIIRIEVNLMGQESGEMDWEPLNSCIVLVMF